MKNQEKNIKLTVQILALSAVMLFSWMSCGRILEASLTISNGYGQSLDFFIDSVFKFLIEDGSERTIEEFALGRYLLEVKIPNDGKVVDRLVVNINVPTNYIWDIGDPPDINLINAYGETLKIYMDGTFQFELLDGENKWIENLEFGNYAITAKKASNDETIESIIISVTKNIDYFYTFIQ